MSWLKGFAKRRSTAKGFQSRQAVSQQTFILEPILTPSGIVDGGDETPDPTFVESPNYELPDVEIQDSDFSADVDTSIADSTPDFSDVETEPLDYIYEPSLESEDLSGDAATTELEADLTAESDSVEPVAEDDGITTDSSKELESSDSVSTDEVSEVTIGDRTTELEDSNLVATDELSEADGTTNDADSVDEITDSTSSTELADSELTPETTDTTFEPETDSSVETGEYSADVAVANPEENLVADEPQSSTTEIPSTNETLVGEPEVELATDTTNSTEGEEVNTKEINEEFSPVINNSEASDTEILEIEEPELTDYSIVNESAGEIDSSFAPLPQLSFNSGVFTVDETGEVGIDFLFDGGGYQGELAIFSLDGMDEFEPGSAFIQEAARRALSSSEFGHVVISDISEAARFSAALPHEGDFNFGEYQGVKTFTMRVGDTFAVMLVPNGTVQQVFASPDSGGATRPLFSLSTINPIEGFHFGQIADVTGEGNTFVMEDLRVDGYSDRDYNDITFQVRGATGQAALLDEAIDSSKDWRTSDMGQALIEYARPYVTPEPADEEIGQLVNQLDLLTEALNLPEFEVSPEVTSPAVEVIAPESDLPPSEVLTPEGEEAIAPEPDLPPSEVSTPEDEEAITPEPDLPPSEVSTPEGEEAIALPEAENSLVEEPEAAPPPVSDNSLVTEPETALPPEPEVEVAQETVATPIVEETALPLDPETPVADSSEPATEVTPPTSVTDSSEEVGEINNSFEESEEAIETPLPSTTSNLINRLEAVTESLKNQELPATGVSSNSELLTRVETLTQQLRNRPTSTLSPAMETAVTQLVERLENLSVTATPAPVAPIQFEFSKASQPLVGVIDTGFAGNNPDLDYSRITLGRDWVDGDDNPLLVAGEGSEHGTHILGIIGATQDNGVGIDGINDDAPIWLGRAIGSGKWADSLVEFADAAKESGQPNAVVNLSLDLTQVNPDGSVTTRYEFTPQERAAIEYARQHNVLIVVAAGNDGGVMSALGQSSQEFDNIITVGAAERVNDAVALSKAYDRTDYSSHGYGLDIMAPGGSIDNPELSLTGDSVGTMAGSSVATAKVTGAVSQVWAANPSLSYRQVIEIIKNTATDLKETGWDLELGAGLLNIVAAVHLAKVTKPETHETLPLYIPETWGGEGFVTPMERAAATEFIGKYYEWDSYILQRGEELLSVASRRLGYLNASFRNFIVQHNSRFNPNYRTGASLGERVLIPREVSASSSNWQTAIDNEWQQTKHLLGNPTSGYLDATRSPQGTSGKFRYYENGTIHWTPQHGAVAVWHDLHREYGGYSSPNGSGGWLGFPTKREYAWNGGKRTDFEGGYIYWNGQRAKAYRPGEMPNGSQPTNNASSGIPGKTRQYIVRSGEILTSIAQRELGNANRWREISKDPQGQQFFTDAEARRLAVGQVIYLPVISQIGTGRPVTSNPVNSNPVAINSQIGRGSRAPHLFQQAYTRIDGSGRGLTPLRDAYRWGNGWAQTFRDRNGGELRLMLEDGATTAYSLQYGNLSQYLLMDGMNRLGYPRSDEYQISRTDGKWATWQAFATSGGKSRIHFLEGVGSVATWGVIGTLYTDMGGTTSWLGFPTQREYTDGDTIFSDFQGGRIAFNRYTGRTEALRPGQQPLWRQPQTSPSAPAQSLRDRNLQRFPGLQFSTVVSKATGKALDAGGSNDSVYPYPSPDSANEFHQWGFERVGDYYIIINKATGRALDAGRDNGALPYLHADPNRQNDYHLWKLQKVGDAYLIINKATGRALDSGGADGNQIYMFPHPLEWNSFHQWMLNLPSGSSGGLPSGVKIQLSYPDGSFSREEQSIIRKAADNWERIITRDAATNSNITLEIVKKQLNGIESGWFAGTWEGQLPNRLDNSIEFNTRRFSELAGNTNLFMRVAMHEIGNTLGIKDIDHVNNLMNHNTIGAGNTNMEVVYNDMERRGFGVNRNAQILWN